MCLSWGLPLGEKGDVPGHSTALYRAPAPDLTGPVGSVEHHTLTRFYALKTQNELQGLKSPWVVRRVWGMGLMAGRKGTQTSTAGPASGAAQHSLPSPCSSRGARGPSPQLPWLYVPVSPSGQSLSSQQLARGTEGCWGKRDSSHQQQHRDACLLSVASQTTRQDPWDSSQHALGQEAQGSDKL